MSIGPSEAVRLAIAGVAGSDDAGAGERGDRPGGRPGRVLSPPPGWSRRFGPGYSLLADAASDQRLAFAFSVARGLESYPRLLEFRWLYDDQGSHIFDRITAQPEYYQTRTEDAILSSVARAVREHTGAATLVELGSGSSQKTRRLLDAWTGRGPTRYVPIDVSEGALLPACQALGDLYPRLTVEAIAAPYHRGLQLARHLSPLCLVFLGSSIGNFDRADCDRFLAMVGDNLSPGDHFLVGLDLVKDPRRLEAAYNDAAGWSAAFTKNLFVRMNRELGTAFDVDAIEHVAWYDERHEQVEIYARFRNEAQVELALAGRRFRLAPGELVRTEISRKFRPADFVARAARFGFEAVQVFQDPEALFAVVLLIRRDRPAAGPPPDARARWRTTLQEVRRRTLDLIAPLSDEDLRRQHSPLMSPLLWDLAHIAAYEDLWLARRDASDAIAAGEGLPTELDALLNPRPTRGKLPLPDRAAVLRSLSQSRAAALEALEALEAIDRRGVEAQGALHAQGYACALVAQHEAQHQETMLAAIQLRGDLVYSPGFAATPPATRGDQLLGSDTVLVPAGPFLMGTDDRAEAYDNERPRHPVEVPAFRIDATPVTNAAWRRFLEDGGYRFRELWSEEGWRWREAQQAEAPGHWERAHGGWQERTFGRLNSIDPDCPVIHVSWYEADAFARWAGKRLPTEVEWEKAAIWDAEAQRPRRFPWGEEDPGPERCSLGQRLLGPAPVGAYPAGRSFYGCHQMIGDVWEWTSSLFTPYPGFEAFPYREYSEVFFGGRYRVLRGGSWATLPVAARGTFRNWDFPERRQIFSGLRCCSDA